MASLLEPKSHPRSKSRPLKGYMPGPRPASNLLSVLAVVLAAGAMVVSVALPLAPGIVGARLPISTTPTMVPVQDNLTVVHLDTPGACTPDTSAAGRIRLPSAGNLTITAVVLIALDHAQGNDDYVTLWGPSYTSTGSGSCRVYAGGVGYGQADPPASEQALVTVAIVCPVSAAGTYSVTLSGISVLSSPDSNPEFIIERGWAVFYPS